MSNLRAFGLVALLLLGLGWSARPATMQDQCGPLDVINYPIDLNTFQLGQDFGTASPRHQGRYHTGEDWFIARGATLGQPVRAVGRGLVTLSSPNAWGIDGGVVVIRHTLDDGSFIYSAYGHIRPSETQVFPPRLTCVEAGDIVGFIGDARPAPHLHFEMRVFTNQNPAIADTPGPGYTRTDPRLLGWRRPMQMITNMQARLSRGYQWHSVMATFNRPVPPFRLNDNSLLVVDGDRLRRITSDGRILWRVSLARPAVSLHGFEANAFITFSDGTVLQIDVDAGGFLDNTWQITDFNADGPPLVRNNARIYHTTGDQLVAIAPNGRDVLWRVDGIPAYDDALITNAMIALVIDDTLWTLDVAGQVLDQAVLADGVALSAAPDGTIIAYTQGGLWNIDSQGTWTSLLDDVPPGGGDHGALLLEDGRRFVTDGETLTAYTPDGVEAWQARLPRVMTGAVTLTPVDGVLLMTSDGGGVTAVRDVGGVCGFTAIYGDDSTRLWHDLGPDGTLRLDIGDQIIGFDWEGFTNAC